MKHEDLSKEAKHLLYNIVHENRHNIILLRVAAIMQSPDVVEVLANQFVQSFLEAIQTDSYNYLNKKFYISNRTLTKIKDELEFDPEFPVEYFSQYLKKLILSPVDKTKLIACFTTLATDKLIYKIRMYNANDHFVFTDCAIDLEHDLTYHDNVSSFDKEKALATFKPVKEMLKRYEIFNQEPLMRQIKRDKEYQARFFAGLIALFGIGLLASGYILDFVPILMVAITIFTTVVPALTYASLSKDDFKTLFKLPGTGIILSKTADNKNQLFVTQCDEILFSMHQEIKNKHLIDTRIAPASSRYQTPVSYFDNRNTINSSSTSNPTLRVPNIATPTKSKKTKHSKELAIPKAPTIQYANEVQRLAASLPLFQKNVNPHEIQETGRHAKLYIYINRAGLFASDTTPTELRACRTAIEDAGVPLYRNILLPADSQGETGLRRVNTKKTIPSTLTKGQEVNSHRITHKWVFAGSANGATRFSCFTLPIADRELIVIETKDRSNAAHNM